LRKLNNVRSLRPFLLEFPFPPKFLEITIFFPQTTKPINEKPHITKVSIYDEGIEILSHDKAENESLSTPSHLIQNAKLIPYAEISQLKDLETKGVPRNPIQPKPKIFPWYPTTYSKPSHEDHLYTFHNSWTAAKKLLLAKLFINRRPHAKGLCYFTLSIGPQCLSLEEAKSLSTQYAKDFFAFLKNDQISLEYITKYAENIREPPRPLIEYISFRISFWDENSDRVVQPYIAEVRFADNVFHYYTADEGQKLVLVHQETYDEALKSLNEEAETKP
jgi:hypothetical protein